MEFSQLSRNIDFYDVYAVCYTSPSSGQFQLYSSETLGLTKIGDKLQSYRKSYTSKDYTPWLYDHKLSAYLQETTPECLFSDPVSDYLNSEIVRA